VGGRQGCGLLLLRACVHDVWMGLDCGTAAEPLQW
jgi:hypothetical protein